MDLEKGAKEAMGVPDAQIPVPAMATGGEKELLVPDLHVLPIDGGGVVAANMNRGQKKWLPCWLVVVAGSVILLSNRIIHAAPKDDQLLFTPELAMFTVYLCAICLMLRTMKQMM